MATWVIDLDGVMWWGDRPVPGSADAIGRLVDAGHQVVFCTNHALSADRKRAQLTAHGVPPAAVVTSAEAAVTRCPPDRAVLVLGDPSLVEVVETAGLKAIDARTLDTNGLPGGVDLAEIGAVVVGAHEDWDRSRTGWAADAVRAGAAFLATNDDPTFPAHGPDGARLLPGNGAIVAAVAVTAGVEPEVCGKPYAAMAELVLERHGPVDVVVGDLPGTDGLLARRLDAEFALVLSGVTRSVHDGLDPRPDRVAANLAALVDEALGA